MDRDILEKLRNYNKKDPLRYLKKIQKFTPDFIKSINEYKDGSEIKNHQLWHANEFLKLSEPNQKEVVKFFKKREKEFSDRKTKYDHSLSMMNSEKNKNLYKKDLTKLINSFNKFLNKNNEIRIFINTCCNRFVKWGMEFLKNCRPSDPDFDVEANLRNYLIKIEVDQKYIDKLNSNQADIFTKNIDFYNQYCEKLVKDSMSKFPETFKVIMEIIFGTSLSYGFPY